MIALKARRKILYSIRWVTGSQCIFYQTKMKVAWTTDFYQFSMNKYMGIECPNK